MHPEATPMRDLRELCRRAAVQMQTLQSFDAAEFPAVARVYLHLLAQTLTDMHTRLVTLDAEVQLLQARSGTVLLRQGLYIAEVVDALAELNGVLCFDLAHPPTEGLVPASLRPAARELRTHTSVLRGFAWAELAKWRLLQEALRVYTRLAHYPARGAAEF